MNHPLLVGTRVKYNNSSCSCKTLIMEGLITKVEILSTVIVYQIDNGKKIPARRITQII